MILEKNIVNKNAVIKMDKKSHKLVSVMAQARVNKQTLATGYLGQRISSAVVTCFGQRLQSRMSLVGLGAITASQRRQQWSREEERARQGRSADWLAAITGRDIVRRGRFWTG